MKMFTRIDQYQGAVPFTHWVSRIAVTTCIDHLRAQKRRPELRWADLSERETDVLDSAITNENDVAPDDAVAARELVQKNRLPRLFWVEGEFGVLLREAELGYVRTLIRDIDSGALDGVEWWREVHARADEPAWLPPLSDHGPGGGGTE